MTTASPSPHDRGMGLCERDAFWSERGSEAHIHVRCAATTVSLVQKSCVYENNQTSVSMCSRSTNPPHTHSNQSSLWHASHLQPTTADVSVLAYFSLPCTTITVSTLARTYSPAGRYSPANREKLPKLISSDSPVGCHKADDATRNLHDLYN